MKRKEIDKEINKAIDNLHKKNYSDSKSEMIRQILIAGIRKFPDYEDFLKPYPNK